MDPGPDVRNEHHHQPHFTIHDHAHPLPLVISIPGAWRDQWAQRSGCNDRTGWNGRTEWNGRHAGHGHKPYVLNVPKSNDQADVNAGVHAWGFGTACVGVYLDASASRGDPRMEAPPPPPLWTPNACDSQYNRGSEFGGVHRGAEGAERQILRVPQLPLPHPPPGPPQQEVRMWAGRHHISSLPICALTCHVNPNANLLLHPTPTLALSLSRSQTLSPCAPPEFPLTRS